MIIVAVIPKEELQILIDALAYARSYDPTQEQNVDTLSTLIDYFEQLRNE